MALFTAGAFGADAYNFTITGPSDRPGWENATFEIVGQPPTTAKECFLSVPNPRRRYQVEILTLGPSPTFNRAILATRVKLVT